MTQNVFETYLLRMVSEKEIDPITARSFRWWQKLPRISWFCDYNWLSFDQVMFSDIRKNIIQISDFLDKIWIGVEFSILRVEIKQAIFSEYNFF